MTKISDLPPISTTTESDKTLAKGALVPIVQNGTTKSCTVQQMLDKAPQGTGGNSPSGFIQSDSLYGVPREIELVVGQLGSLYQNEEIYLCAHQGVDAPGAQTGDLEHDFNSKKFVARGLSVKVFTLGGTQPVGQLQSVQINTPGQLYKVGDVLQVTRLVASNGNNPSGQFEDSAAPLAQVKILAVDPFIVSNIAGASSTGAGQGISTNMGGATNDACIVSPGFDCPANDGTLSPIAYEDSSTPATSGFTMHDDPGASVFLREHTGTSMRPNGTVQGSASWSDADRYAYYMAGTKSGRVSPLPTNPDPGSHTAYFRHPPDTDAGFSISVALPGTWFAVYINQCVHTDLVGETNKEHRRGYTFPFSKAAYGYPSEILPIRGTGHGVPLYESTPFNGAGVDVEGIKPLPAPRDYYTHQPSHGQNTYFDMNSLFSSTAQSSHWRYSLHPLSQTRGTAEDLLVDSAHLAHPLNKEVALDGGGSIFYNGLWDSSANGQTRGTSTLDNTLFGNSEHRFDYHAANLASALSMSSSFYLVPAAAMLPAYTT